MEEYEQHSYRVERRGWFYLDVYMFYRNCYILIHPICETMYRFQQRGIRVFCACVMSYYMLHSPTTVSPKFNSKLTVLYRSCECGFIIRIIRILFYLALAMFFQQT